MRALLLIAHGSRDPASNRVVLDLAADLAEQTGSSYACVRPAFLEFAEPDADSAIGGCVDCGADEIVVLPYFLAPGRHVTRDVPAVVDRASHAYPGVRFVQLPYAGSAPRLVDAMAGFATEGVAEHPGRGSLPGDA